MSSHYRPWVLTHTGHGGRSDGGLRTEGNLNILFFIVYLVLWTSAALEKLFNFIGLVQKNIRKNDFFRTSVQSEGGGI